jgi:hypothetical protein
MNPHPIPTNPNISAATGANASPGNPVAAINAWNEEASDPKVTDQA